MAKSKAVKIEKPKTIPLPSTDYVVTDRIRTYDIQSGGVANQYISNSSRASSVVVGTRDKIQNADYYDVQEAVNAVRLAGGGIVTLLDGIHYVSQGHLYTDNVTVQGQSKTNTSISFQNTEKGIRFYDNWSNVTFKNITLTDCIDYIVDYVTTTATNTTSFGFLNFEDCNIVSARGMRLNVNIGGTLKVEGCTFDCRGYDVGGTSLMKLLGSGGYDNYISESFFYGQDDTFAIDIANSSTHFYNNYVFSEYDGLQITGTGTGVMYGNTFVVQPSDIGGTRTAITIGEDSGYFMINTNIVNFLSVAPTTGYGVYIQGDNCIVNGNIVAGGANDDCINIAATADRTIVTSNFARATLGGGITDNGTNSVVANNQT